VTQPLLLQAFDHFKAGRLEAAAKLLRAFLIVSPADSAGNNLLGAIYYRQGKYREAQEHLARACAAPGATPEMFNNLGAALKSLGDEQGAMNAWRRALGLDPDYADALNNLGVVYRAHGQSQKAIETLQRAVALKPELAEAQANLRNAYRDVVPPWHFAMVNDRPRNNAFEAAINRAVSGKRVLDIGTGTGLLAMMAARAGASSVTTCEATSVIAERAREIIALNGFADRITVIPKHSSEIGVGRGVAERAQVLITETFSSDLLSEGVLATIEHAHQELLTPDAIVIPRIARACGYLAGGVEIHDMLYTAASNGFNLSPFNRFAPPVLAASMNNVRHEILSDDFELWSFDLGGRLFPMESRPLVIRTTKTGVVTAVVQWIELDLDGETRYRNRPADPEAESHWTQILYRFPRPFEVEAGNTIMLVVGHNRQQLWLKLRV